MRWAWLIALLVPACAPGKHRAPDAEPPGPPPVPSEMGFITVEPEPAAPAMGHMFYVLFPADSDPANKPLFVFFNGGPGVPTSTHLLVDATGPEQLVVDASGQGTVVANAASFTKLGSLLYIDERETGFSYDDAPAYSCSFDMQQDALDFTRVILRVLDSHPQLTAARVVLVGESYGGARAQLILQDLLHYTQVPEVASEVQAHLDAAFSPEAMHPPDEIAQQFFGQLLIEPVVMGAYQLLRPSPPAGVCPYDTRLSKTVCDNNQPLYDAIEDPIRSARLFGGRLEDVAGFSGPSRHGARCAGILDGQTNAFNAALVQRFGPLDPGDTYFGLNGEGGSWASDKTLVPGAFVENLRYVRTLITNATYDGVVDTTQIAPALVAYGVPATLDQAPRPGVARPGWIDVTLPSGNPATIRLPTYAAGHMVTATDAADLRADAAAWLGL